MRVRVIARFKNEHFVRARERAGFPTQAAMSQVTGIAQTTICMWENFRAYPHTEYMKKRVELATGCLFEDMFPPLYCDAVDRKLGRPLQRVLEMRELPEWSQPKMLEQNPESVYDLKQMKEAIIKSLDTLRPREGRVLQMRFGLGIEREMSLDEIAAKEDVSRERVRQIESVAIRKLKHPSRSRPLKPWAGIERHQGFNIRCPVCGGPPARGGSSDFYFCDNYSCPRERWLTDEGKQRRKGRRLGRRKKEREEEALFSRQYMGRPSLTETEKIERAQALMKDFLKKA